VAKSGKFTTHLSSGHEVIAGIGSLRPRLLERWHKPVLILCLLCWLVSVVWSNLGMGAAGIGGWLDGLFLCSATLATLVALGRRLPLQNVVMTAVIIAAVSGTVVSLTSVSGVPFGPLQYTAFFGERIFNVLPWPVPLGWIFLVVNGRGVARLIMRPWRQTNYYGYWVMGLTCLLAVILDLGLEPFAVAVKGYWVWQTPEAVPAWYTAPWVNFLSWFVAVLAILIAVMPWLINKHPLKQPMDYQPLILWLMLSGWIAAGNASHQLWPAIFVSLIGNAVATVFAIRGALYVAKE